jgi:hypothetical protein
VIVTQDIVAQKRQLSDCSRPCFFDVAMAQGNVRRPLPEADYSIASSIS